MEQVRAAVAITGTATEPLTPSMVMFSPGQPNPFNGRTRFSYSLPRQARVEIAVYDLRGRKVRVLRNETQAPGHYFADWDGLDRNGRALASGIYLVRLIAGDQYRTQRVTLMH
jgi:flagellar hook assembly protein FlgD